MNQFLLLLLTACVICTVMPQEPKKIIIKRVNGKTIVQGLDKVESHTLNKDKTGESRQDIVIEVQVTTTQSK